MTSLRRSSSLLRRPSWVQPSLRRSWPLLVQQFQSQPETEMRIVNRCYDCSARTFLAAPRFEAVVVFFAGAALVVFAGAAFFAAGFLAAAALGAAVFLAAVEVDAFAVLVAVLEAGFLVVPAVLEAGLEAGFLAVVVLVAAAALGLEVVAFAFEAGLVFSFASVATGLVLGASLTRPEGPDHERSDQVERYERRKWLTLGQNEDRLLGTSGDRSRELRDLGGTKLEVVLALNVP